MEKQKGLFASKGVNRAIDCLRKIDEIRNQKVSEEKKQELLRAFLASGIGGDKLRLRMWDALINYYTQTSPAASRYLQSTRLAATSDKDYDVLARELALTIMREESSAGPRPEFKK